MKVKMHSMRFGYKEADARIEKDPKGRPILFVDGVGQITALDYIKQGMKLVQASDSEFETLKAAGYAMKNEFL
ncbi:MAG: hypothetical protein K8S54_11825 [Spirochaetia bacterium]|nr:hypothetical protein [Spirochaetia bacterium]